MLDSIRLKARMESITNTLVCVVLLGIAGYIWLGHIGPYFMGKFSQPTPIDLSTFQSPLEKPIYFASATSVSGQSYATGYYWSHAVMSRRPNDEDHFGLLDLGGQYLMIYTPYPVDEARTNWIGTLYPMPGDIQREILTPLQTDTWPQVNGLVLPYYLQVVEAEEGFGYWMALALAGVLAFIAVYFLIAVAIVTINPKRHDIYKDLARFGAPLNKVAEKIEADFRQGITKIGPFEFGRVFIVRRSSVAFQAMLYRDLVWAYLIVREYRSKYGTTIDRSMVFCDKYGKEVKWKIEDKEAHQILKLLNVRAPWAYNGLDRDVQKMWARDRKRMIEIVEQNRQRLRNDRAARHDEPQPMPTPIADGHPFR